MDRPTRLAMKPRSALATSAIAAALLSTASAPRFARADMTVPGTSLSPAATTATSGVALASDFTTLATIMEPSHSVVTSAGVTNTGWNINRIVLSYNASTDTMNVDIKTDAVAGDADGKNLQGQYDPTLQGGLNPAHFGGRKSITVGFAPASTTGALGSQAATAGVPAYKTGPYASSAGIDGFRVAAARVGGSLETSYGAPIVGVTGNLTHDPSVANPDFEFNIQGFSKIPGINLRSGFYINAYAGSPDDIIAGEDYIDWTRVPGFSPAPQSGSTGPPGVGAVPEPGSLALIVIGGGLGLWARRKVARKADA